MSKCPKCVRDQMVTLATGEAVCNYCPRWALECEARELLNYPMQRRRKALSDRIKFRGAKAVYELKAVMNLLFYKNRR